MKKLLTLGVILILSLTALALCACGDIASQLTAGEEVEPTPTQESDGSAEGTEEEENAGGSESSPVSATPLALICGAEGVENGGYAQAAWAGLSAYGQENGLMAAWYAAAEETQAARLAAVGQAVESGAQLIVCCGPQYGDTVYEAQFLYPELGFVLCDGEPHSLDFSDYQVGANTYAVLYTEQEAGFLAGYALVAEGCSKIGFLAGMSLPATVRCGAGFIQGAAAAAEEKQSQVELYYSYTGLLHDDAVSQNLAGSWYANGVEAIYVCGDLTASVCGAAEAAGAWALACDFDQYQLSDAVISSTVKDVQTTVYQAASAWYQGSFWGGKQVTLGLSSNAVKLAMDHERFSNFSTANLRMLLNRFDNGEISITAVNTTGFDLNTLSGERVKLVTE